jgi:exodeoxyribonuclease VII small subunit
MEARMQESAHHPARPARADVAGLSFEEALAELEGIVKALESGQGSLEKAIEDYERGAALRRHCERKLAEAEQKVQAIVEGPDGPSLREVE